MSTQTELEKVSTFSQMLLWFGAAVSIAEILAGALLAPLGFEKGMGAILAGHVIGAALLLPGETGGVRKQFLSFESTVRSGDQLKRSCTFDRDLSSEDLRNHAETSQRSTPVKSSHVQGDPLCTWESITRKPTIRKPLGIARKTRNWPARAPPPNVQLHLNGLRRPAQPENDPHQGTRPNDSPALRPRERPAPPESPDRSSSHLKTAR